MPGVFVLGALHLDVVVDAPHLPALDETVVGRAVAYRFGGKGGNQAVAAARMGARVAMAGRVGRDGFGADILAALDAAGVDRSQVRVCDGPSGMSVAIVEDGGEYGAVIVSGVNGQIDGEGVAVPEDTSVVLLQNEIPGAANLSLARTAPRDACLVLNAAPARAVDAEVLRRLDLLILNRVEAAQMTGVDVATGQAGAAVDALRALGPSAVVVTLGAGGLVGAGRTGAPFQQPAHPVRVKSTHGAGDAFVGALAAELALGKPLETAAAFAQAAAALTVATDPDARGTITREAVAAFQGVRR